MKKILTILRPVYIILLVLFVFLGIAFIFYFLYEINSLSLIGSNAPLQKIIHNLPITTKNTFRSMEIEPFASLESSTDISVSSGLVMSFGEESDSPTSRNYNFVIAYSDISNLLGKEAMKENGIGFDESDTTITYDSQIPIFHFKNTTMGISSINYYNPDFSTLFSPYQSIDSRHVGGRYFPTTARYQGDFCLAFFTSTIIHQSRREIAPDCHLIVLPGAYTSYPYAKVGTWIMPLNEEFPATLQVEYLIVDGN